jgi:hypothetical protein
MRTGFLLIGCALALPGVVRAYQADLVPASNRVEARDVAGRVTIGGADGSIHVVVENVMTPNGDFLDSERASVHMKVRVNGVRRSITLPMTLDAGDGEVISSLGLVADDKVVVSDIRVRGPNRHTLAQAGVVTKDVTPTTLPPPAAPPSPSECPAALESCQSDLDDCNVELDDCEAGF